MVLPLLGLIGAGLATALRPQYESYMANQAGRRNSRALEGMDPGESEAHQLFQSGLLSADQYTGYGQQESQFGRSLAQDDAQFWGNQERQRGEFNTRNMLDLTGATMSSNEDLLNMTGTGDWSPDAARQAVFELESGGNYGAVGPETGSGDRAYGAYQVMGANIPSWTKAVLGKEMTPQEFVADPAAQDAVWESIFGGNVKRYGMADALSIWHSGVPLRTAIAEGRTDGYMATSDYARKGSGLYGAGVDQRTMIGMEARKYGPNWAAITPEERTGVKRAEKGVENLGQVIDYVERTNGAERLANPAEAQEFRSMYQRTVFPMIKRMNDLGTLSDGDMAFIQDLMGKPLNTQNFTETDLAKARDILSAAQADLAATGAGFGIYSPWSEPGYAPPGDELTPLN